MSSSFDDESSGWKRGRLGETDGPAESVRTPKKLGRQLLEIASDTRSCRRPAGSRCPLARRPDAAHSEDARDGLTSPRRLA
jgi:hypothetical protein